MNQRTTGVAVRLVVALTTFMVAAVSAAAAPPPPQERNQVKATLLADVAAVKPGATFDVGVLLEIAPGWHVYWTNPGDSGLPTQVKFQFPEGFKVGDLRYPTPSRFTTPDGAASFGYSGSVLLTAPVEAPAELKELKELKLAASATWLVCKEVCLPGTAKPELNLPISKNVAPANEALFKKWVEQVPVDVKDSPDVAKLEWTPGGDKAAGEWALVVTWKQAAAPQDVNLFPGPDEVLDVRTMDAKTEGNQTRMVVGVRVLAGQKPKADHLPAVLGYTVKDGVRRGVKTDIAVLTGDGKKAG